MCIVVIVVIVVVVIVHCVCEKAAEIADMGHCAEQYIPTVLHRPMLLRHASVRALILHRALQREHRREDEHLLRGAVVDAGEPERGVPPQRGAHPVGQGRPPWPSRCPTALRGGGTVGVAVALLASPLSPGPWAMLWRHPLYACVTPTYAQMPIGPGMDRKPFVFEVGGRGPNPLWVKAAGGGTRYWEGWFQK